MRKLQLALLGLLGQDVALKSVLSLDFPGAGQLKPLLGTGLGLHLGHCLALLTIKVTFSHYFLPPFGAMNIVIRLPSSFGICSTFP